MPDLQSEMKKVAQSLDNLKFDDGDDDAPTTDAPTTDAPKSMTRVVWDFYLNNPMSTTNEAADALGIDRSRTAALSLQLMGRKLLSRSKRGNELYRYTATTDTYPDSVQVRRAALIKAHQVRKAMAEQRRNNPPAKKKARAPKAETPTFDDAKGFNAAMLVGGLTPFQAKAVYDELKKLFGG